MDLLVCKIPEDLVNIQGTDSRVFLLKYSQSDLSSSWLLDVLSTCSQETFQGEVATSSTNFYKSGCLPFQSFRQNAETFAFWTFETGYNSWIFVSRCQKSIHSIGKSLSDNHAKMCSKKLQLLQHLANLFSIVKLTVFLFCPFCLLLWL